MSRPERVKRPRIAADGTVLSSTPTQSSSKKPRLSASAAAPPASPATPTATTPKQRTPQRATKKASPRKSIVSATPDEDGDLSSSEEARAPLEKEKQQQQTQNDVAKSISQPSSSSALAALSSNTLQKHLPIARRRVLSVLAGQLPPAGIETNGRHDGSECVGMSEQWMNLRATVRGTMQGEGNSALLVGARGSGKSLLLDSVLRSIDSESSTSSKQAYHLVQLDGAIQPTDRLSMRELARQLVKKGAIKVPKDGEEGALDFGIDDEEGLAEEMEAENADGNAPGDETIDSGQQDGDDERRAVTNAVLSSLANTTSTILTLLSTGGDSNKALPLIITLSSFDLYTSRPRQALLYVLLDAVQAGSYTPGLCVIGMTSRLDTTDLLEKRVRSRFGGRTINIWPEDVWLNVTRRALLAGVGVSDNNDGEMSSSKEEETFAKAWREEVDQICSDKTVIAMLDEKKEVSNVVRTLYGILYPIVAYVSTEEPSLHSAFAKQMGSNPPSSYSVLSDLTVAEFALLIASKQLLNRDREVFNFEMCYDELKRFVSKIEMDRLGAAVAPMTSSSISMTPNLPNTPDTPSGSRRRGGGIPSAGAGGSSGSALGWQGLTDRNRVMEAFRSLLQLELLQPEANLNSLSIVAATASIPTTQTGSRGAAGGSLNVRTEYLRVKCTLFPQDIIAAAKSKNRRETLGTHMVQWAIRQG